MTVLPLEFTSLCQVLQEILEATLCLSLTAPVRRSHPYPTVNNLKPSSADASAAQLPSEREGWQKWT